MLIPGLRQEMIVRSLSYQMGRKSSKAARIVSEGLRSQLEEAPSGQRWTLLASITAKLQWIEYIKYV